MDVEKIYLSQCLPGCTQDIIDEIDRGSVICNFVGHGTIDQWASEAVFRSTDVSLLNNNGRPPLVIAFTCLNGYFHHVTNEYYLAEEFVRAPGGGAVACWAHSGLSLADPSGIIGGYFYDAMLNDGHHTLGSAVCVAKLRYEASMPPFWDQGRMLILLGDPALEMGFEGRSDLLPGAVAFDPPRPASGAPDTITAALFNAGREPAHEVLVQFHNGDPRGGASELVAEALVHSVEPGGRVDVSAVWDSVPAPGKYPVFAVVDPENAIIESNEWNNLRWDTLTVRRPGLEGDTVAPSIELSIDGKTAGVDFYDNDFVSSTPVIKAVLRDSESGVDVDYIKVILNGEPAGNINVIHNGPGSEIVTVEFNPESLRNGTHSLLVEAYDCALHPNRAALEITFVIESALKLRNVTSYPNPCRDGTHFFYQLSRYADDVRITIYSVNGGAIRRIRNAPGARNGNLVYWDCRDLNRNGIASGVYFYRVSARGGGGGDEHFGKLVVVR